MSLESKNNFLRFIKNIPMPMPDITTGIIHIEIDCTPAKSNAVWSMGIEIPPIWTPDVVKTIVPLLPTATPLLASLINTPRIVLPPLLVVVAAVQVSGTAYAKVVDHKSRTDNVSKGITLFNNQNVF